MRTGGFDFLSLRAPGDAKQAEATRADPSAEIEDKLLGFFLHSIETDKSAVYGDGYRHAQRVVEALGLDVALGELRASRSLPNGV